MNTFSPRTFHVEVDVLEYMIFLLGALCSHAVLSDNYLINIFFIFSSWDIPISYIHPLCVFFFSLECFVM